MLVRTEGCAEFLITPMRKEFHIQILKAPGQGGGCKNHSGPVYRTTEIHVVIGAPFTFTDQHGHTHNYSRVESVGLLGDNNPMVRTI